MKIELNKELDKEVYVSFHDAVVGGADFGKKIRDDHPDITEKNYIGYIDSFYMKNKSTLNDVLKDTNSCFNEIKDPLFLELKRYFGKDHSRENYTCYLSIFNCNPRYLENKSFQVYYKRSHDMRKEVIAHELTHFAFYDFCHGLDIKENSNLWELSEIFNVIFLNLTAIQKAIGAEELLFYPNLKDKLEKVREVWNRERNAENFIKTALKIISETSL
jgi:hypothetical protein